MADSPESDVHSKRRKPAEKQAFTQSLLGAAEDEAVPTMTPAQAKKATGRTLAAVYGRRNELAVTRS